MKNVNRLTLVSNDALWIENEEQGAIEITVSVPDKTLCINRFRGNTVADFELSRAQVEVLLDWLSRQLNSWLESD